MNKGIRTWRNCEGGNAVLDESKAGSAKKEHVTESARIETEERATIEKCQ